MSGFARQAARKDNAIGGGASLGVLFVREELCVEKALEALSRR